MNQYINIKFQPDEESPIYYLRNVCYTKLHKVLHDQNQTTVGISFPSYKFCKVDKENEKLGDIIRLHGDKPSLEALQKSNWLGGLSGYCEVGDILPVPEKIEGYRTISRKQHTMTLKKLEKRVAYQKANGTLKTDEAVKNYQRQYKEKMYASSFDNPYLELQSASNGNRYRVFIKISDLLDRSVLGDFNHFGLSKTATIPWF